MENFYKKEDEEIMMDKRKVAEIILEELDQNAPVIINHNQAGLWIRAILRGLTKVDLAEKTETPGAATPRESR